MNEKAEFIGMSDTVYSHPAGGVVTTPKDLAMLWRSAWNTFQEYGNSYLFSAYHQLFRPLAFVECGKDKDEKEECYLLETRLLGYPGIRGDKGGNVGFSVPGYNVPFCPSWKDEATGLTGQGCLVIAATRLDASLIAALQQSGSRYFDAYGLFDYGFRKIFTPDHQAHIVLDGINIKNLALDSVFYDIAVTAVIDVENRLHLHSWRALAAPSGSGSTGSLKEVGHEQISFTDLGNYNDAISPTLIEISRLAGPFYNANYITAHKNGDNLVIDMWNIGPISRTDNY
jgi:hypothetical protein